MTPHPVVKRAKAWYDKNHPGLFEELLIRCVAWGVIIKTPDMFLLAEPVWTDGKSRVWGNGEGNPNCWWVHVLFGRMDIPYFMSLAEPLEYLGWERNNDRVSGKIRIYKWEKGIKHGFK